MLDNYATQLARDGFAIVEDVLPPDRVADLSVAVASIPDGDDVRRKNGTYGIRNLFDVCPAVRELAMAEDVRRYVAPVLGDTCFAVRAVFFDKVPGANWKLGWHQDCAIAVVERRDAPDFVGWSWKGTLLQVQPPSNVLDRMLAIRVHLDDCGADNGPLRVLPGSHSFGWLDHELDAWKARVSPRMCLVRAGGIVAMKPLLIHASSSAELPTHRRVIHIEYACETLPNGLQWRDQVLPARADRRLSNLRTP